jgi:undecaprenyl-diphosphatase
LAKGFFTDQALRAQAITLLLAFLPASILGVLFHETITTHLFHPKVVAWILVIGGVVMFWSERCALQDSVTKMEEISWRKGFMIGCIQTLAMIPGVSRSGATIIGARLLGVSRIAAAEFSFFLAIPTVVGASAYSLFKHREFLDSALVTELSVGAAISFVTAWIVVRWLLGFIKHHSFIPFAFYRIFLGTLLLLLL